MNYSNIKKIYLVLVSFWVFNFLFSLYQIIPNTDDAYYILPAIGFHQTNEIAFHQLNYTYTFFERFPLYTILQGIFYKVISPFFNINFYTYRLLNLIIFCNILILSFLIIKRFVVINKSNDFYKIILFPIFLSISPFSQTYLLARPELLGISFILIGIYLNFKKKSNELIGVNKSLFFFLGLAVICHPVFLIYNLFFFFYLISLKKSKNLISSLLINLIPISFLIIYYYINLPTSLSQINIQASGLPYFQAWKGLIYYGFDIFFNKSTFIGIINTFYYLPILIIIFLLFFFIKKEFINIFKNRRNSIIFFLFCSSLTLLILERNHPYLISIVSFFLILTLFLIPWKIKYKLNSLFTLNKSKKIIIFIFSLIILSSWNLIHFTKFKIFKNEFLDNSSIIKLKNQTYDSSDAIIITRPEIVPYFIKEFNQKYYDKSKKEKIFWFFPDGGRAKNNDERINSLKEIDYIINNYNNSKILWFVAKKNFNSNCLTLSDALSYSESIQIKFDEINNIYNSNKHIVFYAKKIKKAETNCF